MGFELGVVEYVVVMVILIDLELNILCFLSELLMSSFLLLF